MGNFGNTSVELLPINN